MPVLKQRGPATARSTLCLGLVALTLCLLCVPLVARSDGLVHFYYFFDKDCPNCAAVHREVIEPLKATYGDRLAIEELEIGETDNFLMLLRLEEACAVTSPSIPEVFIGDRALVGPEEVRQELANVIEYYLAQGGVALPTVAGPSVPAATATLECTECDEIRAAQQTAAAINQTATASAQSAVPTATATLIPRPSPVVHMAFFFQQGCDECERWSHDLAYIERTYPQVQITRFDIHEHAALNQYLSTRAGVPQTLQLTAPSLFVGNDYLAGGPITVARIEGVITPYLEGGASEPWAGFAEQQTEVEQTILDRFRSFGLWTVLGAGLIDGVNPCAFATMIFLVSYLSVRKRKGRELLLTGGAFTLGVFLAYLGVGLGLLRVLTALPVLSTVGKAIYALTLVLCLALAWGSYRDFLKARQGRLEDMSLKLPERLRGMTHNLIREGSRASNYVLASLVIGFAVSIVELACTGQVYLPTIIFVLGLPEWRARAALALLAYNIMFIIPLIAVFVLVYYGTTSKQLLDWMNRRAAAVKLGTAALFLLLASWLAYGLATL